MISLIVFLLVLVLSYLLSSLPISGFVSAIKGRFSWLGKEDQTELFIAALNFFLGFSLALLALVAAFLSNSVEYWFIFALFMLSAAVMGKRFPMFSKFNGHWNRAIIFGGLFIMLQLPFILSIIVFVILVFALRTVWIPLLVASFLLTPFYLVFGRSYLEGLFPQGPSDLAAFLFCTSVFAFCIGLSFKKVDILSLGTAQELERSDILPKIIKILVSENGFKQ